MSKRSIYHRLALLAAAGVVGLLSMGTAAQAAKHPTVESQVQHFVECVNWLINDPAKHKKFCGPGHEYFIITKSEDGGNKNMVIIPPPPPPAIVPPPPPPPPPIVEQTCANTPELCPTECPTSTPAAYVQNVDFVLAGGNHDGCPPPHHNPCGGMYGASFYVDAVYGSGDCNPCQTAYQLTGGNGGHNGGCGGQDWDDCDTGSIDPIGPDALVAVANRNNDDSKGKNDNKFDKNDRNDNNDFKPKPKDDDFDKKKKDDDDRRGPPRGSNCASAARVIEAPWLSLAI